MRKKLFLLLILLISVVTLPVNAKSNFYAGESIKLNKEYDSTVFAAANKIESTGNIDGISFLAGNQITVKNNKDYLFIAGNSIKLDNVNTKDAFIAGADIEITSSQIRDLYVTGEDINVESDISGTAYIAGEDVTINSTIKGNVTVAAETIKIGNNTNIEGTLKYSDETKITKEKDAKIAKEKTYKIKVKEKKDIAVGLFMDFVISTLSMILIGIILLALNNKVFKKIDKIDKNASSIATTTLIGFAFLVLVPIASLILLVSTIGLGLGVICILLYGIMIYLSAIPTSYFFGNWILKDKIENKYLLLSLSILVLYVIRLIPLVGGIVTFISLCFGLGVYIKLIKDNITTK